MADPVLKRRRRKGSGAKTKPTAAAAAEPSAAAAAASPAPRAGKATDLAAAAEWAGVDPAGLPSSQNLDPRLFVVTTEDIEDPDDTPNSGEGKGKGKGKGKGGATERGLRIFVTRSSGFSSIRATVEALGGDLQKTHHTAEIVLSKDGDGVPRTKIKVYSWRWIFECIREGRRVAMGPFELKPPPPPSKPVYEGMGRRSKYGLLDDQNIMDYVDSLGPSAKLGGNLVWKEAARRGVTEHSWQSMRDRYHKHIKLISAAERRAHSNGVDRLGRVPRQPPLQLADGSGGDDRGTGQTEPAAGDAPRGGDRAEDDGSGSGSDNVANVVVADEALVVSMREGADDVVLDDYDDQLVHAALSQIFFDGQGGEDGDVSGPAKGEEEAEEAGDEEQGHGAKKRRRGDDGDQREEADDMQVSKAERRARRKAKKEKRKKDKAKRKKEKKAREATERRRRALLANASSEDTGGSDGRTKAAAAAEEERNYVSMSTSDGSVEPPAKRRKHQAASLSEAKAAAAAKDPSRVNAARAVVAALMNEFGFPYKAAFHALAATGSERKARALLAAQASARWTPAEDEILASGNIAAMRRLEERRGTRAIEARQDELFQAQESSSATA